MEIWTLKQKHGSGPKSLHPLTLAVYSGWELDSKALTHCLTAYSGIIIARAEHIAMLGNVFME
jgi:hypothetical protein